MWKALDRWFSRGGNGSRSSGPIVLVALIVADQDRRVLADVCTRNGWGVRFATTCGEAWEALTADKAPVVLCDRDLPGADWRDIVHMMASCPHRPCAMLLSKVADDYLWNEVIARGGYDVLAKPLREDEVTRAVRLAWTYWSSAVVKR